MTQFDLFSVFGARPQGARLERILRSPQATQGQFHNSGSTATLVPGAFWNTLGRMLFGRQQRTPPGPIPVLYPAQGSFAVPPQSGLRATWLGHASVLLEIDSQQILIDPVFSKRVSPFRFLGPKRFHPVPLSLDDLPPLDVILLSHDHYDHMDVRTIRHLMKTPVRFVVPLGVGAHLERWGVAVERIEELDWDETAQLGSLSYTATKAVHFSGRSLWRNNTLWCSWVIKGPRNRVFYSGDSGFFDGFDKIGTEHGPFDLSIFTVGAYDRNWARIHFTPEQAIQAHVQLNSRVILPVHWGTFNLAFHAWDEPAERMMAEAQARNVTVVIPRPGEVVEPAQPPELETWWRGLKH